MEWADALVVAADVVEHVPDESDGQPELRAFAGPAGEPRLRGGKPSWGMGYPFWGVPAGTTPVDERASGRFARTRRKPGVGEEPR